MTMSTTRSVVLAAFVLVALARPSWAGDPSKEDCVDAHSRGQDAKEQGKLSLARKLFLSCAQSTCPAVVQNDCARFADELSREQPSMSFSARDGNGADLPDTSVYVDGVLVAAELDTKLHDVDPGTHTVKFSNAGTDKVVTILIQPGEKGRMVTVTFGEPTPKSSAGGSGDKTTTTNSKPTTRHPTISRILIYAGGVATVAGLGLGIYGWSKVPENCHIGSNTCDAELGDPVFGEATTGVNWLNTGIVVGSVGAAVLAVGLVWYFTGASTERPQRLSATPWLSPTGGGVSISGAL